MKLIEALEILSRPVPDTAPDKPFRVFLATGFTPLDLKTFLAARLRERLGGRQVEVVTGLYGDLTGSIENLDRTEFERVFVALEWEDLDPRLGLRSLGSWHPDDLPAVADSARMALDRLARALDGIASAVISLPTLAPAPLFTEIPETAGPVYWSLQSALCGFAGRVSASKAVVLHPDAVAAHSPVGSRLDVKSDLATGFPYRRSHADGLAECFCAAAFPESTKKGLITDLDDTLWRGLVGEEGVDRVAWDLEGRAQMHGLYQKTVASLAASGVLTAVASKNDPELVRQALARLDILTPAGTFYPVEAHWQAKSESVARILKAWNIAADSVVFVDDNELELAEVARAHPGIEVMRFPKEDPAAALDLLIALRRRFGKRSITTEDKLRVASLKSAASVPESGADTDDFLAGAEAVIVFDPSNPPEDERPLELVNKTNQFNLNGVRYSPAEWAAHLRAPAAFLLTVAYRDRFGPLGRIAVLSGTLRAGKAVLTIWVMSCRAFSRRIEYKCLEYVYEILGASSIEFAFRDTGRNGPLREFLAATTGTVSEGAPVLSEAQFRAACPPLHHRSEVLSCVR